MIIEFSFTIDKVQENTEFYWRYQRYSFVREYFERPPFAYPPVIGITHVILAVLYLYGFCHRRCCGNKIGRKYYASSSSWGIMRVFSREKIVFVSTKFNILEMISEKNSQQNERWDDFENAATHSYARSIVEQDKKKSGFAMDDVYLKSRININEYNETSVLIYFNNICIDPMK